MKQKMETGKTLGAPARIRTGTPLRAADFKSAASAIPPRERGSRLAGPGPSRTGRLGLAVLFLGVAALPLRAGSGRDLKAFYEARCAVCHGVEGTGRGLDGIRLGPRGFQDPRTFGKATDEELATAIRAGQGAMPAFSFLLTQAEARSMVKDVLRPLAGRKRR